LNEDQNHQGFTKEQQKVLDSVGISRILIPVLIGLAVVVYLIYIQLDFDELKAISWNAHLFIWISLAIFMYFLRHLFYAWRLKLLSDHQFSWWKSIELIFIWEFSSAISPTSIGGSAVALFFLAQEKISSAKSATIVLYTIVLDTAFTILSLFFIYMIFGPHMIRPGQETLLGMDGIGLTFILVMLIMMSYAILIFYGLFVNPVPIKRFLIWMSKFKLLNRFKTSLRDTATDIVLSSSNLAHQSVFYHLNAFISTSGAWICRFLAINFIIVAFVSSRDFDMMDHLLLLGRGEVMHVITAFSPTPGGAGIAELIFGRFYSDFIAKGLALLAALIWRIITYYPYLIAGVIIIPNWIRNIVNRRRIS